MTPLVVMAMLGMMEVGYSYMIRQTVTFAAREGARAASLPGGTMDDVNAAVDGTMSGPGLTGYTVTSDLESLQEDDTTVSVTVTLPFNRSIFTGSIFGGGTIDISSTATMGLEDVN